MTKKEIKQIIRQLKTYEMDVRDVPQEVCYHKDIIEAERSAQSAFRRAGGR